ncbi:hypothetical protein Poly21_52600 [Allorhodopirellula heiligendammensis]|uniref:Uncharacterized protein n=1 Tax=Allorhodopirellula heiligendammensis TaxID=2714739 RepID=A0A5C6BDW8_9BACT|nr:hypothetical protein Poly21_52600 [Allorhodopirellula heiligendammensis]
MGFSIGKQSKPNSLKPASTMALVNGYDDTQELVGHTSSMTNLWWQKQKRQSNHQLNTAARPFI